MVDILDKAMEALRRLEPDEQNRIAQALLELTQEHEPEEIDAEHIASVLEGLRQAERGEFATPDEVAAVFGKFDPKNER
jgi:predicted transcriptional regulator